jgi:hypothetical protein
MLSRLRFRTLLVGIALAVIATLTLSAFAASRPAAAAVAAPAADDDEAGALIGDLVFHADLLTALDRLCPARGAVPADWHGALQPLLEQAFTPQLRELSRRLGADAGSQLVQQRGGCHTRGFTAAYNESKDEYRALFERWRALGQ